MTEPDPTLLAQYVDAARSVVIQSDVRFGGSTQLPSDHPGPQQQKRLERSNIVERIAHTDYIYVTALWRVMCSQHSFFFNKQNSWRFFIIVAQKKNASGILMDSMYVYYVRRALFHPVGRGLFMSPDRRRDIR